ncbi:hypothetical protein SOVF_011120 [Spinacia oleracea]|nr:hypothetical protein SOVF_011120 [Spinacia oleracea]
MGPLIEPPPNFSPRGRINYSSSVIGRFVGRNPPVVSLVQHIVRTRWVSRSDIRVHQFGSFFLFECRDRGDMEAIIRQHTAVVDGRLINFRKFDSLDSPDLINFNTTCLWVRVHGLPLPYLTEGWVRQIFEQVGYVDIVEDVNDNRSLNSELRAKVLVDISQPLLPGCYIPLEGDREQWVYLKYEGVFRFCKKCGCAGHSTSRCLMDEGVAERRIQSRIQGMEGSGLRVLFGPTDYPVYTNNIEGLADRFGYRNTWVDLRRLEEPKDVPLNRRLQRRRGDGSTSEESSEDDARYFLNPISSDEFYSGNEDFADDEGSDEGRGEAVGQRSNVRRQPGVRFGLVDDPYVVFTGSRNLRKDLPPITVPNFARLNFEVGESSIAAMGKEKGKMDMSGNLFQTLGIQDWVASMPQVEVSLGDRSTGLLQDVTRG